MTLNLTQLFMDRGRFSILVTALLAAIGLAAFITIPRSEDPQFPVPNMTIRVVFPGASPSDVEALIIRPIEDAVHGLDNLKRTRSNATDGAAMIQAEFDWSTDPERKYDEVVREMAAIRRSLPSGVSRLDVIRHRTSETALMEVALVSEHLPMRLLEKVADNLRQDLSRVPGVRDAQYWGAPRSEVRVALDFARMAALELSVASVSQALARAGEEAPVGSVHAGDRRFNVQMGGAFRSIDSVRAVPVLSRDGRVVRVGDVASVDWASEESQHATRFNGKRALLLTATPKDGVDIGTVTADVRAVLARFERGLPGSVRIERGFFQAANTKVRLSRLYQDFLLALAIVCITLLPLGLRAAGVVIVAIPLSLLAGLATLRAFGFGLDQLSITGFVLSLGLLVDDSVVVVENIARHMRAGADRATAAIAATQQIGLAVAGCTACLILAFLPLLALPDGPGAFIRPLPVSVIATIGVSFLVSLTVIPLLASHILPAREKPGGNRALQFVDRAITRVYAPVLHRALRRPGMVMAGLAATCLLIWPLAGAIGTSLFPAAETPQFLVRVEMAPGASLRATDAALRHVEQRLARTPQVKWFASNLGRGNPQIYYNMPQRAPDPTFAEVAVSLATWEPGKSDRLVENLRKAFLGYPGAKIRVVTFSQGPAVEAPIEIRVLGPDLSDLTKLARAAEVAMSAVPGIRDVNNPLSIARTDLTLAVDEAKAALLGVEAGAARKTVRLALQGDSPAQMRDTDGDDYPVRLRLPMSERHPIEALDKVYVPARDGAAVPLRAVAQGQLKTAPAQVDRYNRERAVTLTAYVQPGHLTNDVTAAALQHVNAALALPPDYKVILGGEAAEQESSDYGMVIAAMVSAFGILAVLVLEFGRFRLVAVVAGIIPLGLLGAMLALWITGNSLSFTAMIGLIALIGIEIKNSILLVDFTEQLRRKGCSPRDAVALAGEMRFLPVLLTSLTAIAGLLPLAIGGSGLYAPMAIALIGGLLASTVLSRVATPVSYLLIARLDSWRGHSS